MPSDRVALTKLILLIDGENIAAKYADRIVTTSKQLGTIVDVRLYGHFSKQMQGWVAAAKRHKMTQVNVVQDGDNSADFKLAIEATDILHHRQLDGFCIASSDTGFAVLVEKIQSVGLSAYGFAEWDRTTEPYTEAFDQYFELNRQAVKKTGLTSSKSALPTPATSRKRPEPPKPKASKVAPRNSSAPAPRREQSPAKVPNAAAQVSVSEKDKLSIMEAVDAANRDGRSPVSTVGHKLKASGNIKQTGMLSKILKSIPELEVFREGNAGPPFVRRRR